MQMMRQQKLMQLFNYLLTMIQIDNHQVEDRDAILVHHLAVVSVDMQLVAARSVECVFCVKH